MLFEKLNLQNVIVSSKVYQTTAVCSFFVLGINSSHEKIHVVVFIFNVRFVFCVVEQRLKVKIFKKIVFCVCNFRPLHVILSNHTFLNQTMKFNMSISDAKPNWLSVVQLQKKCKKLNEIFSLQ